ncbi:MAG: response regulator transcription factor [Nitrospirae bacterium]|nr:response regulator transcription factor [Nitrospirota bacterium]MBI5696298.1 response regulator transcription factor [Nitrospirota bacterium]
MRILVVEDEPKVASFVKKGLEEESYAVDTASDGEEGLGMLSLNVYDAVVLDLMLPKKNGIEVVREMRAQGMNTPVLMLTARDTLGEKIQGLDAGADDYLTKPFAFQELVARLRSLLRRGRAEINILQVDDLSLDPATRKVKRAGEELVLTAKEFALLEYMMRNVGRPLSRTTLSEHVWDINFDRMTNVVDVYINFLRNKVDKGFDRKLIHTVRGVGYMLKE